MQSDPSELGTKVMLQLIYIYEWAGQLLVMWIKAGSWNREQMKTSIRSEFGHTANNNNGIASKFKIVRRGVEWDSSCCGVAM